MPVYAKLLILFLFISIACNAQSDSLTKTVNDTLARVTNDSIPLKPKFPKFEIGLVGLSLYYVPNYFNDRSSFLPLTGLQVKYYGNTKNAFRASYVYSNLKKSNSWSKLVQPINLQLTKQISVGFQHIFFTHKNLNSYWFADFYYQNYEAKGSVNQFKSQSPAQLVFIDYSSTTFLLQQVNSFNLVGGVGIKFLDRKHIFLSVEGGLGVSYYSGTQLSNGYSTTTCTNEKVNQAGVGQISTVWYDYQKLPKINTHLKGTNLNASVLRIVLGVVF
jgi:hypothetical protein